MTTRSKPVYIFRPVLMDLTVKIPTGARVCKSTAPGLGRRNVAKPFTYVESADTGEFLGMVCRNSLHLASKED